MSRRVYINDNWTFTPDLPEDYVITDQMKEGAVSVRLPHTVKEVPLHYFDEEEYQMVSLYERTLQVTEEELEGYIFITFDGAAHDSTLYVNGQEMSRHHCGYTAFTTEISEALKPGDNLISLRLDSRENLNIPPFGHVIDYMTFGGIYRDVYVEYTSPLFIQDLFAKPYRNGDGTYDLDIETTIGGACEDIEEVRLHYQIEDYVNHKTIATATTSWNSYADDMQLASFDSLTVEEWDTDHPNLYICRLTMTYGEVEADSKEIVFGFREAIFKGDGFYLNGKKVKLRGLNRHQSYPYVGYAMPDSMQVYDAEILKKELKLNAVRTSHYPQSQAFIDACDRLGLLVFTELPGWQHMGDAQWKKQAVDNVADMVLQYRNHPSIILWGVRINESPDDDQFYKETNQVAHGLDHTRMTGGVRCIKKSNLLEDVYTYNDFVHDGQAVGAEPKKNVTSDMSKAYLVSEYNGHMYPTKNFDSEVHRREHALRHARVLDAVAGQADIAGSFGWCMFDYNTHQDFGSGDRICYHGVMDPYRNPKMAAAVYASQADIVGQADSVLEISSAMDIGELAECIRGDVYAFTNADSVKFYKNDILLREYKTADSEFKNLAHGPVLINDFIGQPIMEDPDMKPAQAALTREVLNAAAIYGMGKMPKKYYLKSAWLVARYHMTPSQAVQLYNKYIGDWGGKATSYRFEAIKDGQVVKTVVKSPAHRMVIDTQVSHRNLKEGKTYDVAAIRIQLRDEHGNILAFANEPLRFETSGDIELIGPHYVSSQGGMTGTYVKTLGRQGAGQLRILSDQCQPVVIDFTVE